ncbi:MAG: RNA pseudouridine synthase [Elusimicrobia bacterium HGW-Elusimicrobia-1]|nr:MAG: RNA pseudouridine synthase [Elusimicrobia bacterium HGW-Elusimicrobia-1]
MIKTIVVKARDGVKYTRLDALLATEFPEMSRSFFQKLIESRKVTVDGVCGKNRSRVVGGETVSWDEPPPVPALLAQDIPLDIIYEDDDIIGVNKPAGFVVHPACGHPHGTLANALSGLASSRGESWRPYLVHRLDKDTTGVMIAAKNERAKVKLSNQFKARTVAKTYIAVVKGVVSFGKAVIDAPLGRSASNRFVVEVGAGARKESLTEIEKIAETSTLSVFAARPKTGRTHQIRAHFAYIGHPILGDTLYGGAADGVSRPLLHALRIEFDHPVSGRRIKLRASVPPDMAKYVSGVKL